MATYFQRSELELVHALRPSDGLAQLTAGGFDAAILDVMLPEMDGFELSRIIRAEETAKGQPRTPIVAFTAAATAEEVRQCTEAGMDDFLAKPVDLAHLRAALIRWLGE